MSVPTLPGITALTVTTPRLRTRVLFSGPDDGEPVLFVHGNASSATFWEETMLALPSGMRGIAPDLRGYGGADPAQKIDATRGMCDFSDDLRALLDELGIERTHVVGHSMGGAIIWQMIMDYPARLRTVTLSDPGSPYGFGGTKGLDGQPQCRLRRMGGGVVIPDFPKLMAAGDRGTDNPQASLRGHEHLLFEAPFVPAREEIASSLLSEHVWSERIRVTSSRPITGRGRAGCVGADQPPCRQVPAGVERC